MLGRLAFITKPQSQAGARRLRALAFLAALMRLYTGRYQLRMKPREGMQALAERTRVQVRPDLHSATCSEVKVPVGGVQASVAGSDILSLRLLHHGLIFRLRLTQLLLWADAPKLPTQGQTIGRRVNTARR